MTEREHVVTRVNDYRYVCEACGQAGSQRWAILHQYPPREQPLSERHVWGWYQCPSCGHTTDNSFDVRYAYCPSCGMFEDQTSKPTSPPADRSEGQPAMNLSEEWAPGRWWRVTIVVKGRRKTWCETSVEAEARHAFLNIPFDAEQPELARLWERRRWYKQTAWRPANTPPNLKEGGSDV